MGSAILNRGKYKDFAGGFTLLEVMIAVAILSISLVALLGAQSHSLSLTTEAQFNTTAAMLAQEKIAEVEAGLIPCRDDQGDYGEEFLGYKWSMRVSTLSLQAFPGSGTLDRTMCKVELSIAQTAGTFNYTTTYYSQERRAGEQVDMP